MKSISTLLTARLFASAAPALAAEKPELVAKTETMMKSAHEDDPHWPMRNRKPGAEQNSAAKTEAAK